MSEPAIKAIAPWFGGKRRMADRIVAELGPHRCYWGVCCGSLAVELAKPPSTMETCIDLHGDLTNLAFVLQDPSKAAQLYERLSRTLLSREIFFASAEAIRGDQKYNDGVSVDRAYDYFVVSWLGRNGVSGTSSYNSGFCARYTANGGHAAKRFRSAVDSIPAWHDRLRNLTIIRDDIFAHLPRIADDAKTAIYVDPPYLEKGAKYLHDFTEDDHARLATELSRFTRARVVVSYYEHPRVRSLYDGWTVVDCETTKAMANQGQRDKGKAIKAPEVLMINGDSVTEQLLLRPVNNEHFW